MGRLGQVCPDEIPRCWPEQPIAPFTRPILEFYSKSKGSGPDGRWLVGVRIGITAGMGGTGSTGAGGSGASARPRFAAMTAELADYEKAGVELIVVPELYGFDAVSRLGYVAAKTSQAHISSGILQLYTRTPSLLAMTAASLDDLSDGRFELGIGT